MTSQSNRNLLPHDVLTKVPLFEGLAPTDLEQLLNQAHEKQAAPGEFFFFQGDPADRIYLLIQGRVRLSQSGTEGNQVLMRVIRPGTLFGAVAMAQGENYPVFAEAAEASEALYWTKSEMMTFVSEYPQLALNAIKMMAGHVMEFQERYRQMSTERVERRLARTVLRLAGQVGRKIEEGVLIDLPITRQDLAEMSGTTLYTVSRILTQWESQGLISSGRERVVIRFPHGLVRIAEDLQAPGESGEDKEI